MGVPTKEFGNSNFRKASVVWPSRRKYNMLKVTVNSEKGEVLIDSGADYGMRAVRMNDYTGQKVWVHGARKGLKDVAWARLVLGGK